MATIRVGIRDLIRNSNILKDYDYVEIEDKKTKQFRGVYLSEKMAKEFKKYLEEKRQKKIQDKLDAIKNIVQYVNTSKNPFLEQFDKDDPKVLQKTKGTME